MRPSCHDLSRIRDRLAGYGGRAEKLPKPVRSEESPPPAPPRRLIARTPLASRNQASSPSPALRQPHRPTRGAGYRQFLDAGEPGSAPKGFRAQSFRPSRPAALPALLVRLFWISGFSYSNHTPDGTERSKASIL